MILAGVSGQAGARSLGRAINATSEAAAETVAQGMLVRATLSPEALPRVALSEAVISGVPGRAMLLTLTGESVSSAATPYTYRDNKPAKRRSEEHAFFDKRNAWLTLGSVGVQSLDAFTTRYTLDHYSNVKEGSPVARPFENQGWAGTIGFHYGINAGGTLLFQYLAHRRGHHKLERWIPLFTISQSVHGSLMNFRTQAEAIRRK